MYEGFSVNDKYCLYGREYYTDVGTVRYEGNWCDGMRCGRGMLFDKRGQKVFEGEWVNDTNAIERELVVTEVALLPPFTSLLESLTVGESCCNANESLLLNDLPRLRVARLKATPLVRRIKNCCFHARIAQNWFPSLWVTQ